MVSVVEWPGNGGKGLLGFWVNLGEQLGEKLRLGRGMVCWRRKREFCCGIQREKKRIGCGECSGILVSLRDAEDSLRLSLLLSLLSGIGR